MIKYISDKLEKWSTTGLRLPFVHDPVSNKPSVTLMFPYISFVLLVLSSIALHFNINLIVASIFMAMVWVASVIFYLMRKLQKSKFNFKEGSVELDSGEE